MRTAMIRLGVAVVIVIGAGLSTRADPPALLSAGAEAIQKGQWDEAIAVLSQAIAAGGLSSADLATAHTNRGYAYFGKSQADKAIADYTAAIRLAPNDADAHSLRGWAHFTEGKMKQAIADSTAAIRVDPNSAFTFRNRGRAQLYAGQVRPAADDFAAAVKFAPSDVLSVIWLHVARVRAGQADQPEFTANLAKIDRRTWPGPIADVQSGAITQEKLDDIAKSAGDKPQIERACDAQVYLGLLQLAAGDKEEARKLFKAAVEDCPLGVAEATERAVAKLELKALNAPVSTASKPASPKSGPKPVPSRSSKLESTPAPLLSQTPPRQSRGSAEQSQIGARAATSPEAAAPPASTPATSLPGPSVIGTIDISSDPEGAEARLLGSSCETPCAMEVSVDAPFTVTLTRKGYAPSTVWVKIQPEGVSNTKFVPNPVFARLTRSTDKKPPSLQPERPSRTR